MCGLLAFFSARGDAAAHRDDIAGALECLHHRGPDETGVEVVGDASGRYADGVRAQAAVDHRRGAQPRAAALRGDGRYLLTFNGEIYNYIELRDELIRDVRRPVRHQRRRRGDRRRVPLLGRAGARPAARHVRLRHLGPAGAAGVRRPGPRSASSRCTTCRPPTGSTSPARRRRCCRSRQSAYAGRRRDRHGQPVALPDPAVRARAGHPAPGDQPDRLGGVPDLDAGRPDRRAPVATGRCSGPTPVRRPAAALPRDPGDAAGERTDAHALRRAGRRVPVQRHRLHRGGRAGPRVQPEHPDLHRRLRRARLLRDRRGPGLGPAPRRDHHPDQDRAAGHDGGAAEDRLAPGRPGGRPGAGAALLRGEEGRRARHRGALRRGRGRVLRRVHHLPRAAVARRRSTACPAPMQTRAAGGLQGHPAGGQGQELPGARHHPDRGSATTATPGSSPRRRSSTCCAATTRRCATPTSPPRSTPRPPSSTTSPRCSTSTSTPGCAATSWSRPTGCRWRTRWRCGCRSWTGRSSTSRPASRST